jgi:hypothetical protein
MSGKRKEPTAPPVLFCSRCRLQVGPSGPFSERDRDRLAPSLPGLSNKIYDTVHCFYSDVCDILLKQRLEQPTLNHPYVRAMEEQWFQERSVRPQYVPRRSAPEATMIRPRNHPPVSGAYALASRRFTLPEGEVPID